MEKDEIINKLSSYFRLTDSEAVNIYSEIFSENFDNSGMQLFNSGPPAVNVMPYRVQADENQLELEYDSFSEHRLKAEREIVYGERQNGNSEMKPDNQASFRESLISTNHELKENGTGKPEITENTAGDDVKHSAEDNSYYLWYKDAVSNETEAETLSFEYELMYQGNKESEYQSKMKIYAASFVVFFSVVLLCLVLSPVIYKKYFVTENLKSVEQSLIERDSKNEQNAVPNTLNNLQPAEDVAANPALISGTEYEQDGNIEKSQKEPNIQQVENNTAPTLKTEKQRISPNDLQDLVKTANGWADNKYNVLYIQLGNGRYTIQESSWDSFEKANNRISEIESLGVPSLKGSIEETSLGSKGKWYRVRFGEFSTLGEARQKLEEFLNL